MYRTRELHVITVRQAFSCVNDSNCSPSNISSTPGVKCINGACVCSGSCFTLDGATSKCKFSTCGSYTNNVCTPIGPKSQLTAFLLSFFVMPTGAANFYIGQNGLGMYRWAASQCVRTCMICVQVWVNKIKLLCVVVNKVINVAVYKTELVSFYRWRTIGVASTFNFTRLYILLR